MACKKSHGATNKPKCRLSCHSYVFLDPEKSYVVLDPEKSYVFLDTENSHKLKKKKKQACKLGRYNSYLQNLKL